MVRFHPTTEVVGFPAHSRKTNKKSKEKELLKEIENLKDIIQNQETVIMDNYLVQIYSLNGQLQEKDRIIKELLDDQHYLLNRFWVIENTNGSSRGIDFVVHNAGGSSSW